MTENHEKAFKISVSICIGQVVAMFGGFITDVLQPLLVLGFYTAFPAKILEFFGTRTTDSWGYPSLGAFVIGLFLWGVIYFIIALGVIAKKRTRE